jgi:hypothetical protein
VPAASAGEEEPRFTLSAEQIESLTLPQRRELARRLLGLAVVDVLPQREERRRHRTVQLLTLACAGLIPWIAFLAVSLPRHYEAGNWRQTWVGFDIILLGWLAITAYLGWRRRQLVILASFASGLLLICDCWFDLTTASGADRLTAGLTAVFAELPLALLLLSATYHLLRIVVAGRVGGLSPRTLWTLPVLVDEQPAVDLRLRRACEEPDPTPKA